MGTVNTIIHEHLHFRKVSARWVPRQLSALNRHRRVEGCAELKERFDKEGQEFLDRIITCDETWVHHFTPESKWASKQWKHADSPPPKKFRAIASAGKVMAFSGTNVALFMWIFYPVVPLSTVNITVVFWVTCIRVCGKNGMVWTERASCISRTTHDLILLTAPRAHHSNSAGR